jgi:N-terminal domain of anti-restriction factor ArdC
MASTKRRRLTDDERAKRRREEQELTERAVAQLRSSAGWQRWLMVRSRVGLRRYSVRNQLLICLQDPEATHVAGFRAWLGMGYAVRRGERSHVRVWAPCPPSKKRMQAWRDAGADPRERPRTYFRLEAVFTQAQVEALPPPAQPAPLEPPIAEVQGDSLAWAREPLQQLAGELGYEVVYRSLAPGHGGSCDPRTKVLTISTGQSVNAQVDVACHELAHALVRHDRQDTDPTLDYAAEDSSPSPSRTSRSHSSAWTPVPRRCRTSLRGRSRRRRTPSSGSRGSSTGSHGAWRTRSAPTRPPAVTALRARHRRPVAMRIRPSAEGGEDLQVAVSDDVAQPGREAWAQTFRGGGTRTVAGCPRAGQSATPAPIRLRRTARGLGAGACVRPARGLIARRPRPPPRKAPA